jgi:hypothetical protein
MSTVKKPHVRRLQKRKVALAVAAILVGNSYGFSQEVVHDARGFECGFIYEKTKGGKSGAASCSYAPDKVFSNISRSFSPGEFCDIKEVFEFEDIRLRIDFDADKVVWEHEEGLAPFAIPLLVDHLMRKEHIGKAEATKKVTQPKPPLWRQPWTYRIFYVHKGDEFVSHDPVTQSLPKQPTHMPVYTVTFGYISGNTLYSLFIPDNGGNVDAILSRYWANGTSSWISMRFGKCRALK